MSEHTKSKLDVYKGFDRLYLYANQLSGSPRIADIPDTGVLTEEERISNAAYLKLCWNSHDPLAEQRDKLLTACEKSQIYLSKMKEMGRLQADGTTALAYLEAAISAAGEKK